MDDDNTTVVLQLHIFIVNNEMIVEITFNIFIMHVIIKVVV